MKHFSAIVLFCTRPRWRARYGVLCLLSCLSIITANAQSSLLTLPNMYAVPEAPAFAILGGSPASLLGNGTTRDLSLNLGSIQDGTHIPIGSSVEIAPLRMVWMKSWSLRDYQERDLARVLMNSRLSLGTKSDSSRGTIMSLGLRCTIIDGSDLRLDKVAIQRSMKLLEGMQIYVLEHVQEINRKRAAEGRAGLSIEERNTYNKQFSDEYKQRMAGEWTILRDSLNNTHWNRTRLDLALAEYYSSQTGEWNAVRIQRAALWCSLTLPLSDSSSALAIGLQSVIHRSTRTSTLDSLLLNGALRFSSGGASGTVYTLVDASRSVQSGSFRNRCDVVIGAELEVSHGIWFDCSLGASFVSGSAPRIVYSIRPRFGSTDTRFLSVD